MSKTRGKGRSSAVSRNWSRTKAKRRMLIFMRWAKHYMDKGDEILFPTQWFRIYNAWAHAEDRAEARRHPVYREIYD